MDLLSQANLEKEVQVIDLTQQIESAESEALLLVYNKFQTLVAKIKKIIESPHAPIMRVAFSSGKDSTVVLLAATEAYRQSISEGKIEPSRLLLVNTVDTLIESLVMQMITQYSKDKIAEYASKVGINILHTIIQPPMLSEFFIKWASADKLVGNATRTSDCTPILKVDPSMALLTKQRLTICKNKHVCVLTGQRVSESLNRQNNMKKQGVTSKTEDHVIQEMSNTKQAGSYNYAPIADWIDDEVFNLLRIAGDNPMDKLAGKTIPAYMENFALLLEIYGRATQEVCEIAMGEGEQMKTSGCGGKSQRFGCHFCTQIVDDKSTASFSKKPYWSILGTENALRVRDWLFRVSCNQDLKTHQPKAVDPVLNRIMYQPNVLKPSVLDKMIRYASQLTVDSAREAERLRYLIASNREDDYEGIAAIKADRFMHPKAKKSFLEMYRQNATKPLMKYFSIEHAVMLTFKWAMAGVATLPNRPLAIWRDTCEGKGRIPYPKLNSELPPSYSKLTSEPAQEPIVLRFHTESYEETFLAQGQPDFLSFWEKPVGVSDMFNDIGGACDTEKVPDHVSKLKVEFRLSLNHKKCDGDIETTIEPFITSLKDRQTNKTLMSLNMGVLHDEIISFIQRKVDDLLMYRFSDQYIDLSEAIQNKSSQVKWLTAKFEKDMNDAFNSCVVPVGYFKPVSMINGFKVSPTKYKIPRRFTERVTKIKRNKNKQITSLEKTTTRCKFYKPSTISAFEEKFASKTQLLTPDLSETRQYRVEEVDESMLNDPQAYELDDEMFNFWLKDGGYERALEEHDDALASRIKFRNINRSNSYYGKAFIRKYTGAELLSSMQRVGIRVKNSYRANYDKAIKRAQLFNEAGAFDLQLLTRKQLLAHSGTMTMQQHRQDKAKYLLEVRKKRNISRKIVREEYEFYQADPIACSVEVARRVMGMFFLMSNDHLKILAGVEKDKYGEFGYNKDGTNSRLKEKAYNAWFSLYSEALASYSHFKKLLLSQECQRNLKNVALEEIQLSTEFKKNFDALLTSLNNTSNVHSLVINQMMRHADKNNESETQSELIDKMTMKEKSKALSMLLSA